MSPASWFTLVTRNFVRWYFCKHYIFMVWWFTQWKKEKIFKTGKITFPLKIFEKLTLDPGSDRLCHLQRCIQTPFKHLRWSVLRKKLMAFSRWLFSQNASSKLFDGVLNTPLTWNLEFRTQKMVFLWMVMHK